MPDLLSLDEITDACAALVGGKALGLARLAAAGLPVPPGFVVTTLVHRRLNTTGLRSDPAFVHKLLEA